MSLTDTASEPQYLEVTPTSCIAGVDELDWAEGLVAVRAGSHVLGLRANNPQLKELLEDLFAPRLVPDATPDRNFSVWLAPRASDSGVRDLHRVYRAFVRTMRTRSARRALDSLWHELDVRDIRAAGEWPLFDVAAFVRDGQAHLLPGVLRRTIVDDLRRWEQGGFRLVPRPWLELDLAAGELIVPPPTFALTDEQLADRLYALDLEDRPEEPLLDGRYPIATWTTDGGQQSPATRVAQAGTLVLDRERHAGPQLLAGIAGLLPRVGDLGPQWDGIDSLRAAFSRTN